MEVEIFNHRIPTSMVDYAAILHEKFPEIVVLKFLYFQSQQTKTMYLLVARQDSCPALARIAKILQTRISLIPSNRPIVHPFIEELPVDTLLIDESLISQLKNTDQVCFLWTEVIDCSRIMEWKQFIDGLAKFPATEIVNLHQSMPEHNNHQMPGKKKIRERRMPRWIETACFQDRNLQSKEKNTANELHHLRFSRDFVDLLSQDDRQLCPKCNELRKYFCYDCMLPFTAIPAVNLPVRISIVQHPVEKLAKSTSVHGRLLAPAHVELVPEQSFDADQFDPETTMILLPSDKSQPIDCIPRETLANVSNVILLDGPWQKVNGMLQRNPRLQEFRHVSLSIDEISTHFWRYNSRTNRHLSTIEAIYYFCRQYAAAIGSSANYDDLLYYFAFLHALISENMENTFIEVLKNRVNN